MSLLVALLFTGPIMLGAFFLAPDPPSSPAQPLGMWIYGLSAGFLSILIQVKGQYYDAGVPFGILLVSLASPLMDKLRPKARGKG
jgi:electron transport complex protein RnfD